MGASPRSRKLLGLHIKRLADCTIYKYGFKGIDCALHFFGGRFLCNGEIAYLKR